MRSNSPQFTTVTGWASYRKYLQAYIEYRKKTAQYSLARFSNDVGFQSQNYASLIVSGKRNLSSSDALRIARFLELTETETRYFSLLIQHNDAQERGEQKFYKSWLDSYADKNAKSKSILKPADDPELIAEWYTPALMACLHSTTGCSVAMIRQLTGLSTRDIKNGVERLVARGVIRRENDQYFIDTTMTDAKFGAHFQFKDFQTLQIRRSLKAVENFPANGARFSSNVFLLSEPALDELRARLRELLSTVDLSQAPTSEALLTQFNLQLFDFKAGV